MIPLACSWNHPGINPYRGTFVEWIKKQSISDSAKLVLTEKVRKNDFDDTVYISRDSIVSSNPKIKEFQYGPNLTHMAFGNQGKECGTVDRAKWSSEDLQGGMVFCTESICVVRPAICNNWSFLTRGDELPAAPIAEALLIPALVGPEVGRGTESSPIPGVPAEGAYFPVEGEGSYINTSYEGGGFYAGGGGFFGNVNNYYCSSCCDLPPVSPVPEPSKLAYMFAGLLLICIKPLRRKMK